MVFLGLVTAWRLAEAPTSTSPSSWYATIEGVVRAPSEFSITRVLLPSMIDTHEFVVPRSMPMILPMLFLLEREKDVVVNVWITRLDSREEAGISCAFLVDQLAGETVTSAGRSTRSAMV
jgi:hypothetical protein